MRNSVLGAVKYSILGLVRLNTGEPVGTLSFGHFRLGVNRRRQSTVWLQTK